MSVNQKFNIFEKKYFLLPGSVPDLFHVKDPADQNETDPIRNTG